MFDEHFMHFLHFLSVSMNALEFHSFKLILNVLVNFLLRLSCEIVNVDFLQGCSKIFGELRTNIKVCGLVIGLGIGQDQSNALHCGKH